MRILRLIVAALLVLGPQASPASGAPTSDKLTLERIVLVARHGVRSPTQGPDVLSKATPQRWPDWPVAPGILTDHGRRDVTLMGGWLRADYARRGLWPAKGCLPAGSVYAWADGKDQRTRVSGQALLDGAFPGCGLHDAFGTEDQIDPLFSATDAGACPIDAEEAKRAVLAQSGGDLDHLGASYDAAKAALAAVTGAPLDGANTLGATKGGGPRLTGPLALAGTQTENLFLEYAQGMPAAEVGWGRAGSEAAIAAVMPLHDLSADLMRRTPYLATHNGALLMRAVLAALQGQPGLPGQGGAGGKLTAVAGHATHLSNLAGILGVDWTLTGQPDKTPPDAMLVFEVWKSSKGGERFVRLALVYQTLDQLRSETPLDGAHPAGRVDLPIPACADGPGGACRLATLTTLIEARLPAECRKPADPRRQRPLDPVAPRG
jgi:4-phytase/acid phosphatase